MNISFVKNPQSEAIDFLTEKINEETPEYGTAYSFAFFMRNDEGELVGGCNGSVVYGAIYTDQLWVHSGSRKLGLGRRLMEGVHEYGRANGCTMATVGSMSFQGAQGFYEQEFVGRVALLNRGNLI